MASLLKKLASPFYEFSDKTETGQEQISNAPATPEILATPVPRSSKPSIIKQQIDEETKQQILAEVSKTTPRALNDFLAVLESMKDLSMDDQTRFKAAFAALKGNVDTLLAGTQKQLEALENAGTQFEAEIKSAQRDIDLKRKQAGMKQEQADQLSQQIVDLRNEQSQILMSASQEEQTLSNQQAIFTATLASVRAEINELESQITNYLVTTTSIKTRKRT